MYWIVMFIAIVLALSHWQIAVWVIGVPIIGFVVVVIFVYGILALKHKKETRHER